jgi:hypothetical protein
MEKRGDNPPEKSQQQWFHQAQWKNMGFINQTGD